MKQHIIERMLYILLGLVFIAVGVLMVVQMQSNDRIEAQNKVLKDQVAGQKEVLKGMQELIANQDKTTTDINHSLSCVLAFFSTPNSTDYYISDFSNCTITSTHTGESQIIPLPQSTGVSRSQTNTKDQTPPQTNTPSTSPVHQPSPPVSQPNVLQSTVDNINKGITSLLWGLTHIGRNR